MKKILYSLIMLVVVGLGANLAHADALDTFQSITKPDRSTYTLLEPLPCVPTEKNKCAPGEEIKKFTVNQFIEYVFKFAIALAVLLATIQVIIGGFEYMGNDSYSSKSSAKKRFWDAGIGLGGALVSFLILQTIDPRLVQVNTEIQPICPPGASSEKGNICNTSEVTNFASQLEKDLKVLSTQNKNEVYALDQAANALKQKIAELEAKEQQAREFDGDGLTNEELIMLEKTRQELRENLSKQTQLVVSGSQQKFFAEGLNELHKINVYNPDGTAKVDLWGNSVFVTTSAEKQRIIQVYNKWANDPNLDAAAKQKLEFTRDFYIKQLDTEYDFLSEVTKLNNERQQVVVRVNNKFVDVENSKYTALKTSLNDKKSNYAKELTFLQSAESTPATGLDSKLAEIKKDPLLLEQYKTLVSDRINVIETSLASKPK